MNRIYKLKFDKRRNELVVVSEITAGMGKEKSTGHIADLPALSPFRKLLGTLTPVSLLTGLIAGLLPAMVLAADLPAGGQIVGGQGSISTSGNQMTIHQQTQNMATNWHSFDIGKNNTVQFVQPDSSSVALNRVTGASGSQIMGTLKANGQVFILNPNGVLFGKDARVNVAGLVASTKNISTADFMKGQYTLSGEGNPGAQVVNQGSLTTAKGGYIVLAGERVSNSGSITTPGGKSVLAAGKMVTLQLDNGGLTSVSVNGSVVNALVENRGLISATDGKVYLTAKGQDMLLNTVVNNSGTIEAKGLASRGGEIVLSGGDSGVVSQSGHLLADSQSGQGGKITLEGHNIHLAGSSLTSATGKTGGGEVYVGGGWQGQDSRIKNASKVVMDQAATVDVSATENGKGGTAVLWSDDYTNFRGTVLAKGGAQSGHGGRVETSSHQNLQASGEVDASARAGQGGEWLLDPTDVTIVGAGADTGISSATVDGTDIFTPTAGGAQILNSSIVNQLNAGTNVTVKTSGTDTDGQSGNITLNADITKTAGGDAALTLAADGNITLSGKNITSANGKLDITLLGAGSNTGMVKVNNSTLNSNGGNITVDQLNHTSTGTDGNTVTNPNAMTIKVSGSTLNATASDSSVTAGDVVIRSYNPGVDLFQAAYNTTVRNGGAILQIGDTSHLSGRVVTVEGTQAGEKATSLPVFINGATLTAERDITLRGVASNGAMPASLELRGAGNTLTATEGNITMESTAGCASLNGVFLNGVPGDKVELTALNGTINLSGAAINSGNGVKVTNAVLNASKVCITGMGGVSLQSANLTSSGGMNITGTINRIDRGAVYFDGANNIQAVNAVISGVNNASPGWISGYGVQFTANSLTSFVGCVTVNGSAPSGGGVLFSGSGGAPSKPTISISNGVLNINAFSGVNARSDVNTGVSAITFQNYYSVAQAYFNLSNATVNINATAKSNQRNVNGFSSFTPASVGFKNGFIFSGVGNVNIYGNAVAGEGVNSRLFNNTGLKGDLSITGHSESGTGVLLDAYMNAQLTNAVISGSSNSGRGVAIEAGNSGVMNLNNSTVNGVSAYGVGLKISGNNVAITNGTLTGYATAGNGSGVLMVGGSHFLLDGVSVTGHAVNGSGVSVNGTLIVNNGTQFSGEATGSGDGVAVSGNLTTTAGTGVSVDGTASSGNGVVIAGDTGLVNATITGRTDSGSGVNIAGNLTTDNTTKIQGQATGQGTGVLLEASLTGGNVSGVSERGTGLQLSDNAVVREAALNGESASGEGVVVTGAVSLDDTTAATLNATSVSGTGLSLENNANVSIQTITKVTQEKKDADGNPVLDADGNPETETVTTQAPVTTPVTLTGTSAQGTGIATEGNVSISGVVLNGSTTADTGTGVSLGGNLTIADDISGVTAGATGSGTALVVNNASIHSDGYTDSGKDFVINASVSGNGTAIKTQGSSQLDEVVLNGEATSGGTAVELGGKVSGANITGTSDSGTAVRVTDGAGVDGSVVKGHSDSGTGMQVNGSASLNNSGLSGTTQTGTGTAVTGSLTADNSSQVTGSATQDGGAGVTLDGTVTGASVTGEATSGDAVRIAGGSQLTGADIKGTSVTGTGIKTQGNVTLEGGTQLAGGSEQGAALDVSGTLNHDPDSSVTTTPDNTGSVIGNENIHEVIPVVPPVPEEGGNSQPDHLPDGGTDKPAVDNPSVPSEPV
ncbi:filamentous hemagglutinin N-terminal domain-containing protein, partial [Salmonella enterica subsp. enterica serovar Sandiego]|nr:filamentous hemagglutinin N-terminal domain-containing protein [Salmonella enterica subsp. enterica serovar Sandiego]